MTIDEDSGPTLKNDKNQDIKYVFSLLLAHMFLKFVLTKTKTHNR